MVPATNRAGTSHLCLLVDDLRAAHASLSAQGVRFKSEPVEITAGPNLGSLVVYMYDPGASRPPRARAPHTTSSPHTHTVSLQRAQRSVLPARVCALLSPKPPRDGVSLCLRITR